MNASLKRSDDATPNTKRRRREEPTPTKIPGTKRKNNFVMLKCNSSTFVTENCTQEYYDRRAAEGYRPPLPPLRPKTPITVSVAAFSNCLVFIFFNFLYFK